MIVVDTRVDDSHHNALTQIALLPHFIGTHLNDILCDFARSCSRTRHIVLRNPVVLLGKTHHLNVVAAGKVGNGCLCGIKIQGIRHPQDIGRSDHTATFHIIKCTAKVVLRSVSKSLQLADNKLATFCASDEIGGTMVELRTIVLRFHDNDDSDLLVIVATTHFFAQQRVDDSLGVACHAADRHQE